MSLNKFIDIFQRNLKVTHEYTLYMQSLPSTSHSVEQTPIFTLIMHAEPGEDLPPPSQRMMFVPLLSAGKLITTAIPTIHVEYIVRAFLSAFGNAENLLNLQLYDTNLLSLKTLTLEPKTQGIWRKLATSVDKLPNPLEEAPYLMDQEPLISKQDIEPIKLGDGYDDMIKQSSTDNHSRRRFEAMDLWGHEKDLPQIHRLTFNVRMPWRIKDDNDNLDCKIRMFGDDIYRGLRQAEVEGKTTEEGMPGWIPQSLETGHTDNIVVKTSRVSDNWEFVLGKSADDDGDIFGPDLDRADEIEPFVARQPTPIRDSPDTRKRKREAPQVIYNKELRERRQNEAREMEELYLAPQPVKPLPQPLSPLRRMTPQARQRYQLEHSSLMRPSREGRTSPRKSPQKKSPRKEKNISPGRKQTRAQPAAPYITSSEEERISQLDDRSGRKVRSMADPNERKQYMDRKVKELAQRKEEERRKRIRRESDERKQSRRAEAERRTSGREEDVATTEARVTEAIEKSQRRLEARRARKSSEGVAEPSASATAPAHSPSVPRQRPLPRSSSNAD